MLRICLIVSFVSWLFIACSPSPDPAALDAPASAKSAAPAEAADAAVANQLAEMTQALRKYSAEKRQVPSTLNELAAAGYLKNLPPAPAGTTFAIDSKNLKVILK